MEHFPDQRISTPARIGKVPRDDREAMPDTLPNAGNRIAYSRGDKHGKLMKYDSPKQIRRRQEQAEDKPARRRQSRKIAVFTDRYWDQTCNYHLQGIHNGTPDVAGRHARALVTMAAQRRALQIMRDKRILAFWTAMDMARNELLNVEAA